MQILFRVLRADDIAGRHLEPEDVLSLEVPDPDEGPTIERRRPPVILGTVLHVSLSLLLALEARGTIERVTGPSVERRVTAVPAAPARARSPRVLSFRRREA
jgi:hypothetical protein